MASRAPKYFTEDDREDLPKFDFSECKGRLDAVESRIVSLIEVVAQLSIDVQTLKTLHG